MNDLRFSVIHRNLDAKMKVAGFEIYDLLFVLSVSSVMNLIFGNTFLSLYLVFLLPVAMAVILFFVKRDQPDRFLVHLLRYYTSPGVFSAGVSLNGDHARRRIHE